MVALPIFATHQHITITLFAFLSREANPIPILGGIVQPWLPMADIDANIGEYVFAALSTNVEGLVCRFSITDVAIP